MPLTFFRSIRKSQRNSKGTHPVGFQRLGAVLLPLLEAVAALGLVEDVGRKLSAFGRPGHGSHNSHTHSATMAESVSDTTANRRGPRAAGSSDGRRRDHRSRGALGVRLLDSVGRLQRRQSIGCRGARKLLLGAMGLNSRSATNLYVIYGATAARPNLSSRPQHTQLCTFTQRAGCRCRRLPARSRARSPPPPEINNYKVECCLILCLGPTTWVDGRCCHGHAPATSSRSVQQKRDWVRLTLIYLFQNPAFFTKRNMLCLNFSVVKKLNISHTFSKS